MTTELIKYINQYGGFCRDCADNVGVCPFSGMPCDPKSTNAVIKHTLAALDYGIKHGFIENPFAHAVPDVPELVRYDNSAFTDGSPSPVLEVTDGGRYVLYDQAAEMLAAKNEEIERLKNHLDDRKAYIFYLDAEVKAVKVENKRLIKALKYIAHTFTEDSHGNMKCLPATDYQAKARAALEGVRNNK